MDTNENAITAKTNPFAPAKPDDRLNAGTVAVESNRAATEVVAALKIAQSFPRDEGEAYARIMRTCGRLDFAETATYSYPRGGETVSGPSIRLAEEMARAWGNLEFGIRELAVYDDKETEMEAYCWDMQTNVRSKQTFRAEHVRFTRREGKKELVDPRDVYENNANLGARRLRSRILAIIPPDLVKDALTQCRETIANAVSDAKTLSKRIPKMIEGFQKIGVAEKHIEKRIARKIESMSADDYVDLCAIYKSILDGQTSAADWFDLPKSISASEAAQSIDDILGGQTEPTPETEEPAATDAPDNTEEAVKRELIGSITKAIDQKYKTQALRDTTLKNALAALKLDALENATVDQLIGLEEGLKEAGK